uniref:Cathepsin L-like proteinase n=1 Tax=Schistosoma japonicum TaxID=6182 RepID=C1L736_SCHJA|nr:Cathepsin L-like proteinase precursor [Schistosoma japonicum]
MNFVHGILLDKLDIPETVYITDDDNGNNALSPPESCDWRLAGLVYEPRDQGSCNASYAFAVMHATEIQYAIHKLKLLYLSVQQFIDCTHSYGNNGCHGGDTLSLLKYLQTIGLETEEMYPYTGVDQECMANSSNVTVRSIGYKSIQNGSESDLRDVICSEGPYVVTMNIDENFLHYKSGIYQSIYCNESNLNQSMAVIGYDSNEGIDYWILKNSWGTNWGEDGFVYVRRNYGNMCGIASFAFAPVFNFL